MSRLSAVGLAVPDILLPLPDIDLQKWAVIACDQFTQDHAYWDAVREQVGAEASSLHLILPEIYLGDADKPLRIANIHRTMTHYLAGGVFAPPQRTCVYVERSTSTHKRRGLVCAIDLEQYRWDYPGSALIRATEQTVPGRLPPRMEIRRNAGLETSHVLLLIDDKDDTLLPALGARATRNAPLYNTKLMLNSGTITGWAVRTEADLDFLASSLEAAVQTPFLYAVGDGNHSLAAAKAVWEEHRDAGLEQHPSRFALVEIENLYDEGICFEPIHRVLFNADYQRLCSALERLPGFSSRPVNSRMELSLLVAEKSASLNRIGLAHADTFLLIEFEKRALAVALLQPLLDTQSSGASIDYIHGEAALFRVEAEGGTGILLPPVQKSGLFETVAHCGPLPRKSFSMGDAEEKRFYLECRALQ
jgi:uncharacterized protein (DUF1015 family)